ncbi:MAG: PKD domain-containing protein [Candidatus Thermoplasmatota archaeon]|nr:PKD domain-containing protein [Candidatus Thermoplasmatota archaeon]
MYKRAVSTMIVLALVLMAVPLLLNDVSAADNKPVFGSNLSDSTATTGDAYDFEVNVTDDYTVSSVYVEYWFGSGSSTNTSMSLSGNNWTYQITIPTSSLDTLHYRFHANDNASQWVHYPSATTNVSQVVQDNDVPVFSNDVTPTTGTTGEVIHFQINCTDNTGINSVILYYWYGSRSPISVGLGHLAPYDYYHIVWSNTTDDLHYYFWARDNSTNVATTTNKSITITDNDDPTIDADNSPTAGTTGDSYTFDITASDNIAVTGVTVTWSHGALSGTNVALTDDLDGTYSLSIILDDSLSSMTYTITVVDAASNSVSGSLQTVTVTDNDDPILDADNSPSTGTTGDSYTFDITASDNISVSGVTVTWGHGSLSGVNVALTDDLDGTYSLSIILDDSLSSMTYTITVTDTSSNSVIGLLQTVTVTDNDDPTLDADNSPSTGTTGDSYAFDITASDNIGVSGVTVTWSHGSLSGTNVALTDDLDGTYSLSIILDDSLSSMTYTITVADAATNSVSGSLQTVTVTDNDDPTFTDNSPSTGTTGDSYAFDVTASDNVAMSTVTVTWSHGTLGGSNIPLTDDLDGTYSLSIILDDSLSSMTYTLTVTDTSSNSVIGSLQTVTVTDNDAPTFANPVLNPNPPTTGDSLTVSVDITDNIALGSSNPILHYNMGMGWSVITNPTSAGSTYTFSLTAHSDGTSISYYFTAVDSSSNTGTSTTWISSITDNDDPSIDADNSPTTGTTGDTYTFDITASDNVDISSVVVTWSHGALSGTGVALTDDQDGTWSRTIVLDHSVSSMTYTITVTDTSSNTDVGSLQTISISDNDRPTFTTDNTPTPATTGDSFTFDVELDDNIDGTEVNAAYLLYCYGNDWITFSSNVSMSYASASSSWAVSISVVDTLQSLYYNISARDDAGNWNTFTGYTRPVIDNDLPGITGDTTPTAGTTGDPLNFTMTAQDNIDVFQVYVSYAYLGGNSYNMLPMTEGPSGWYLVQNIEDTISPMSYNFTVVDTSSNPFTGSNKGVSITDNDKPVIHTDMSNKLAEAGKNYIFKTMASDNIGVASVNVEYWFSFNSQRTITSLGLLSGSIYYLEITLPAIPGIMYYIFNTQDIVTPPNDGSSPEKTVEVLDITPPVFESIDYTDTAYAGGTCQISSTVTDDVEVDYVKLMYYFGESVPAVPSEMDAAKSGDDYSFTVDIPDSLDMLHFWLITSDIEGNLIESEGFTVAVMDDDPPSMVEDLSDTASTTGDMFMFELNVTDNIGIAGVNLSYIVPGGEWIIMTMDGEGMNYYWEILLPNDQKGDLSYYFDIFDTSMNTLRTGQVDVTVMDDESPVTMINGPLNKYQHEIVYFNAEGSVDNVGIVSYAWEINGEQLTGATVNYTFDVVGVYLVELKVSDGENPTVSTSYEITIKDADDPVIVLEMPDLIGSHLVLSANASASTDNVGITSYSWLLEMPDKTRATGMGPIFEYPLQDVLGTLALYLTIFDAEGNSAQGAYMIEAADLLPPTVIVPDDIEDMEGAFISFSGKDSYDNVGITRWDWHISSTDVDEIISGGILSYYFENPGRYNITLTVYDSANNSAMDYFLINILEEPANQDKDGDGMPDSWEIEVGLDPGLDDADRDYDGDLLTNLQEYRLGTNPKNSDTDNDGMPDKYEYDYAYHEGRTDPVGGIPRWMVEFEAEGDEDDDGDTNLEEYRKGYRNPLVEDAPEEKEDMSMTYIGLSIVALIVVLLVIVALIFLLGRVKPVQEDFPEHQYPHLYKNVEKTETPEEK